MELETLRRLLIVKKGELRLLQRRGYNLESVYVINNGNFVEMNMTQFLTIQFNDFLQFQQTNQMFSNRNNFSSIYLNSSGQSVLVIYLDSEPGKMVNKVHFDIVVMFIATNQYHHIILISVNGLNTDNSSYIKEQVAGYQIEQFLDFELAIDPLGHAFAPLSIKSIPSTETDQWSEEQGLETRQLPLILSTDPIAKRLGSNSGDVLQMVVIPLTGGDRAGFARIVRKPPPEKKR